MIIKNANKFLSDMAEKFELFKEVIIAQSPRYKATIVSYFPVIDNQKTYWVFHIYTENIDSDEITSPIKIEESNIKFNCEEEIEMATIEFNYISDTIPFPELERYKVYKGMHNIVVVLPK